MTVHSISKISVVLRDRGPRFVAHFNLLRVHLSVFVTDCDYECLILSALSGSAPFESLTPAIYLWVGSRSTPSTPFLFALPVRSLMLRFPNLFFIYEFWIIIIYERIVIAE